MGVVVRHATASKRLLFSKVVHRGGDGGQDVYVNGREDKGRRRLGQRLGGGCSRTYVCMYIN